MKVFLLLVTSAFWWSVSHQVDLKDIARGERLSPLSTHSGSSCDLMLVWCFCQSVHLLDGEFVCLSACICQSLSVQTYGVKSMQILQRPVRRDQCPGSKCQTRLTEPLHFHHVALQMSRKGLSSVLNSPTKALLDLLSVKLKQIALFKTSVQSPLKRKKMLIGSL